MPAVTSESSKATSPDTRLRVLLAHAATDRPVVSELYKFLKSDGFEPWIQVVGYGERAAYEAFHTTHVIVVCLSRNTLNSEGVPIKIESVVELADESIPHAPALIPVRLEECPVPALLTNRVYVDLFRDNGYEQLVNALRDRARKLGIKVLRPDRRTKEWKPLVHMLAEWARRDERQVSGGSALGGIDVRASAEATEENAHVDVHVSDEAFGVGSAVEEADGVVGVGSAVAEVDPPKVETGVDPPKVEVGASHVVVKQGLAEDASERNAINDKPQGDVTKDTLGFSDYVFALRDFIVSQDTTTPLTISINGQWGSGKSSMMRMLESQLESPPPPDLQRTKLRWLAGWARGTFFSLLGRLLIWSEHWESEFIRLGLSFAPAEEVTDKNFKGLFEKFINAIIVAQLQLPLTSRLAAGQFKEYRAKLMEKMRFWAREAARLRKLKPPSYPTVWFNAWKFNQQEQVWAALALATLAQLKTKYSLFSRLVFATKLTYKRTDKLQTLRHFGRKLLVPLALAAVVALYEVLKTQYPQFFKLPDGWKPSGELAWLSRIWTWLPDRAAWLAPVLAAVWQAWKEIENPFRLPVEELIDQPDYKEKVGFIGTFEEDFGRIVEVAIRRSFFWQPRKLVFFIDDLDRCSPLQTASLVEAINLFLDSVGCVFVLGMDAAAVATSIEVKYKELSERIRRDAPDVLSPGSLFLDKIVQIPFNVPRPNKTYINALVTSITETQARTSSPAINLPPPPFETTFNAAPQASAPADEPAAPATPMPADSSAPATPTPKVDRGSFEREDIKQAVLFASRLLKENPRRVKRFINLFRLQIYIADRREMLRDEGDFGMTPKRLAVWVAWYMQWPEVLRLLSGTTYHGELRDNLFKICRRLAIDEQESVTWIDNNMNACLNELKDMAQLAKDSPSHWSKLPWEVWLRDEDFLRCLKHLEPYWEQPRLLDSIVDMTQFTVSPTPVAALPAPRPAPAQASLAGALTHGATESVDAPASNGHGKK
jgi:hypothetical protein